MLRLTKTNNKYNKKMQVAFKSEEGKNEIFKYYELLLTKADSAYEEIIVNTSYGDTLYNSYGRKKSTSTYTTAW